jgi:hypothetical protein
MKESKINHSFTQLMLAALLFFHATNDFAKAIFVAILVIFFIKLIVEVVK